MPNREQKRAAQRERRAKRAEKHGRRAQDRTSAATEEPSFIRYRPFAAVGNYPYSEALATSEFANLNELMGIIEVALRMAHDPNPDHWFPNNISAHALLLRAYQGLQAAANLCALGFYVEATGLVRTVYESAGLARSLAHSPDRAEQWVHAGSWVRDKFSREFAKTMSSPEFTKEVNDWAGVGEDAFAHELFYDFVSKYSHPLATSTLQFLFNPADNNQPALYPAVEEKWFKDCAFLITATAVVVAYALRNAAADFTALPAEWHQHLAAVARKVSGHPLTHLDREWEEHQNRHEAVLNEMRHSYELDDALNSDPTSRRNTIRRLGKTQSDQEPDSTASPTA